MLFSFAVLAFSTEWQLTSSEFVGYTKSFSSHALYGCKVNVAEVYVPIIKILLMLGHVGSCWHILVAMFEKEGSGLKTEEWLQNHGIELV